MPCDPPKVSVEDGTGSSHSPPQTSIMDDIDIPSKADKTEHLLKLIEEDLDSVDFHMRRSRMKKKITNLRAILFPMEFLPDELLLEIFAHYRDSNPVWIPFKAHDSSGEAIATMNTVLCISWVCSRWRRLAIRCSSLWSKFGVLLEGETFGKWRGNMDSHKALVELFLTRSGEHPLFLHLSVETYGCTLSEHPALVMLSCHSTRWCAVHTWECDFDHVFPTLSTLELPALKLLGMLGNDSGLVNHVLANAPLIETFKTYSPIPPPQTDRLFAWKSICNLSFCMERLFPLRNLHLILAACGDLKHLSLTRDWGDHDSATHIHTLPSLESLSISMDANEALGSPLPTEVKFSISSLRAPILKELSLSYNQWSKHEHEHPQFPDINSFLSRSACSSSLTRLSLSKLSLSDEEMVRLLERLARLEELSIVQGYYQATKTPITKRFLESLHAYQKSELHPSETKPLLRNLHTLKLSPYTARNGEEPFDPKAFVDTVLSRWVNPATRHVVRSVINLSLVTLDFQTGPGELEETELDSDTGLPEPFWIYRSLLPLREAGLNITITKQQKAKGKVVKDVLQMVTLVSEEEDEEDEEDEDQDEGSI